MSNPPQDQITFTRVLPWAVLAVLLVVGLVLYFRYGTNVAPIAGAIR